MLILDGEGGSWRGVGAVSYAGGMGSTCADCAFFVSGIPDGFKQVPPDLHVKSGTCHRYPPERHTRRPDTSGTGVESWWEFPAVKRSEWCGQYQEKEAP